MFTLKKRILRVIILLCSCLIVHNASAATYSPKVGAMISALIAGKSYERTTGILMNSVPPAALAGGIASMNNESAYRATLVAGSTVAAGLLTAGALGATAPFWLVLAVGTAVAVTVPIAVNAGLDWILNPDGSVTVSGGASWQGPSNVDT
jgi:hypothetical protein